MAGQPVPQVVVDPVGRALRGHHERGQCLVVGRQQNGAVFHVRVRTQRGLHLPDLHAVPVDLHLFVVAAQELQSPRGGRPDPVPGAEHPSQARQLDEALGGQHRVAQIAARHAVTADQQLPVR